MAFSSIVDAKGLFENVEGLWGNSSPVQQLALSILTILVASRLWQLVPATGFKSDEPPCYPYYVPFLGHTIPFAMNANKVFRAAGKLFGLKPYTLMIAGEKHYIITDPQDVSSVLKNSEALTFTNFAANHMRDFYTIPDTPGTTLEEIVEGTTIMPDGTPLGNTHQLLASLLSGKNLEDLVRNTILDFERSFDEVQNKLSKEGSAIEVDFSVWVRDGIGRAATNAAYGPELLKTFPGFWEAYWKWHEATWKMLYKFPSFLVKEAFAAREELVEAFMAYLADGPEGDRLRRGGHPFSVARRDEYNILFPLETHARIDLSLFQAFHINSTVIASWVILRIVLTPGLLSRIREEAAPAYSSDKPDVDYISSHQTCPLLHSVLCECLRHYVAPMAPRHVVQPIRIGGYTLQPGNKLLCPARASMMSEQVWGDTASEFVPERFLDKPMDFNGRMMRPFGGGLHLCPGKQFAMIETKVYVASVLTRFNVEFLDGMPKMDEASPTLGTMGALGVTSAIITRRQLCRP
ncbi:hypothetical protein FRB96_002205 [Tulasnella sp. 330]|nr:hypothetical protein FRB96_002205 [Tulasnella sp. 330]